MGLTQLLRLPATINAKYESRPVVQVVTADEHTTITLKEALELQIPQEAVSDLHCRQSSQP